MSGDGPSEEELTDMVDRSRAFATSAEHTSNIALLQQIARVRVLANTLGIRALLLEMFRDDNDRGRDDENPFPMRPNHPRGVRSLFPVLAA